MRVSGQSDRLIQPGKSEEVVINLATGPVRGKLSKVITVVTNDRAAPSLRLDCQAEIRSALTCEPNILNLGSIKRDSAKIEKTVRITRGAAGPITPRVMTTTNPLVKAELREIEAGSTYDLDVVAEPPWPNGTLRAAVRLETGVTEVPVETVMVTATLKPRVQASPPRFYIRPDPQKALRLAAYLNWDDKPGKATGATVNDTGLTVRLEEQGDKQVIALTAPPGYTVPPGKNVQVIVKTDDPAIPILQIPVTALPAAVGAPAAPPAAGPAQRRVPPAASTARPMPTAAQAGRTPAGRAQPK
jgi:hypothetical protein